MNTGADRSSLSRNTGSDLLKFELEEMVEVLDAQLKGRWLSVVKVPACWAGVCRMLPSSIAANYNTRRNSGLLFARR